MLARVPLRASASKWNPVFLRLGGLFLPDTNADVDAYSPASSSRLTDVEGGHSGPQIAAEHLFRSRRSLAVLLTPPLPAGEQFPHRNVVGVPDLAAVADEGPDRAGEVLHVLDQAGS